MGGNYEGYGILPEDDDLEWCIDYFWDSLEDDIYPKEFLPSIEIEKEDPGEVLEEAGIDMTSKDFWQNSFELIQAWQNQLEAL